MFIEDPVPKDTPGAREIGFSVSEKYNASEILFRNITEGRGDKVAVYSPEGNSTYSQICSLANKVGNALASLGLSACDRVLLLLNDTSCYPSVFFGAIRAGFVPMLINTLSPKDLIQFFLRDSGARAVVIDVQYEELFDEETLADTAVETLIAVNGNIDSSVNSPVDSATFKELSVRCENGDTWFDSFPDTMEAAKTARDDMAFWMYSSGSTGRPKGIVHLQHDMLYSAKAYADNILNIKSSDICFSVPKIFFAYGLGNSLVFPFHAGASCILYSGQPVPSAVFDCVNTFKPTLFFGLPTLYNALLKYERISEVNMSSVRMCLSAAEVLSEDLFNSWKSQFGFEIVEGLGSTELTHIYLSNRDDYKKTGSAGKVVPGYEVRLCGLKGEDIDSNEQGVLMVRGDSSAPCYWNREDKTQDTMRADWIWTGDRFEKDEDGFFFFKGRSDDLIKISGQWVYPLEIELTLADHPHVRECAVLPKQLADRRMTTQAFVVLADPGSESRDLSEEIKNYVKAKLLPYKYPREIEYMESLPKTGTGKIDRQALKQLIESQKV